MGFKRAFRFVLYNLDLLVNWTVVRLKDVLDFRGIVYFFNVRRSALVYMYKESEFLGFINRILNDSVRFYDFLY